MFPFRVLIVILLSVGVAAAVLIGRLPPQDYNAAHADHFHLDMGPYTICR